MMIRFASHRDVIDAWPSVAEFATDIGIAYERAKGMRRRNSITFDCAHAVVLAAAARGIEGVSHELLARLVSNDPSPASDAGSASLPGGDDLEEQREAS